MFRALLPLLLLAAVGGCRAYDGYTPIANEQGLIPAAQYARYGTEQAQAVAIGRSLGRWYGGSGTDARATQVSRAAQYAGTLPGVAHVVADTMGYRLTVTFKSGWRTAIVPINDGVEPQDTPGLPGAQ